jgi:hypothetical protein
MPRNHLSPETQRRALDELLATRTLIDMLEEERDEAKKAFKSIIDEEWTRERFLLGILRGSVSEQIALPGLEGGRIDLQRKIGSVLRAAVDAIERITGASAEVEEIPEHGNGAADVLSRARRVAELTDETTITLTTPGGKSVTATQGQMKAAMKELDRRKKKPKDAAPGSLEE